MILRETLTCDLDVHGGLVMSCHVLRLHLHPVHARALVTMLDGLVCNR